MPLGILVDNVALLLKGLNGLFGNDIALCSLLNSGDGFSRFLYLCCLLLYLRILLLNFLHKIFHKFSHLCSTRP